MPDYANIEFQILNLLNSFAQMRAVKQIDLYNRYLADKDGVPIFSRKFADDTKVNSKINNDFVGTIVDTKVGYLIGKPIVYAYADFDTVDARKPNIDSDYQHIVDGFVIDLDFHRINLEVIQMSAICGTASKLLYINPLGGISMAAIKPWSVIYNYEQTSGKVIGALRYFTEPGSLVVEAEYYDETNLYTLKEISDTTLSRTPIKDILNGFRGVSYVVESHRPHGFCGVPLIEYKNNPEKLGDFEKVEALIDAYDRILSDEESELEQFRLAYLALYGLDATDDDLKKLKQTGAFKMAQDGKVEWIVKNIDGTAIENLLKELKANIYTFSKSVDFSDSKFGSNLSAIAIKFKLYNLEQRAVISEVFFNSAESKLWKMISGLAYYMGYKFDASKMKFSFTRNIPVDILSEARIQRELKGLVSNHTRLGLLSFVDNPEQELDKMRKEATNGTLDLLDAFFESVEKSAGGDEGTGISREDYAEWRSQYRDAGKDDNQ